MDFRSVSKCASTRLAIPSTVLTPQLEDYDLFYGYRELAKAVSSDENQPFMLVFNMDSVLEPDLKITRLDKDGEVDKDVLQVSVLHKRREAEGVVPFTRDCSYKYALPEELSNKPLSAFWTSDNYLLIVESSNLADPQSPAPAAADPPGVTIMPRRVKSVYKPTVDADVLRHSVALAELGLFNAKRVIQNCSFHCPDVGRPRKKTVIRPVNPAIKSVPRKNLIDEAVERIYKEGMAKDAERDILIEEVKLIREFTSIEEVTGIEEVKGIERDEGIEKDRWDDCEKMES